MATTPSQVPRSTTAALRSRRPARAGHDGDEPARHDARPRDDVAAVIAHLGVRAALQALACLEHDPGCHGHPEQDLGARVSAVVGHHFAASVRARHGCGPVARRRLPGDNRSSGSVSSAASARGAPAGALVGARQRPSAGSSTRAPAALPPQLRRVQPHASIAPRPLRINRSAHGGAHQKVPKRRGASDGVGARALSPTPPRVRGSALGAPSPRCR